MYDMIILNKLLLHFYCTYGANRRLSAKKLRIGNLPKPVDRNEERQENEITMDTPTQVAKLQRDAVTVVETNLDNISGEVLGWLMDKLFEQGALDVNYMPMMMKKNRPAVLLRVIARPEDAELLAEYILSNTTTLGVRMLPCERLIAERRIETVESPWGTIRVKLKLLAGVVAGIAPEYEDCAYLADKHSLPLLQFMQTLQSWLNQEYHLF